MLRILIEGNELDLSSNEQIELTYQMTDFDNPTAEKNTFSKSLKVDGTPTNNKIFGDIWKLDRNIVDGDSLTGAGFDARKRVDAVIYDNNDIIESGYIQLNSVTVEKNKVSYEITFYGGLGDFFYSLMYNEDGNEVTLKDLYYGLIKSSGEKYTKEEENTKLLCQWNKDYIVGSWWHMGVFKSLVECERQYTDDGTISSYLTACPTYSGLYDDFANDKVLVNKSGWIEIDLGYLGDGGGISEYVPSRVTSGQTNYHTKNNWTLVETPRELVEWEVGCIASSQQRPAVKLKWLLDAISDPENNGGYTVQWDSEITDESTNIGQYFNNAYVLMDRFNFETTENAFQTPIGIKNSGTTEITSTTRVYYNIVTDESSVYIDNSEYSNPSASLSIQPQVNFKWTDFGEGGYPDEIYNDYFLRESKSTSGGHQTFICYYFDVTSSGNKYYSSPIYAIYSDSAQDKYQEYNPRVKEGNMIAKELGRTDWQDVNFVKRSLKASATSRREGIDYVTYAFDSHTVTFPLPPTEDVQIRMYVRVIPIYASPYKDGGKFVDATYSIGNTLSFGYENDGWQQTNALNIMMGLDEDGLNSMYEGSISPSLQSTYVTKEVLFGNSKSPFEYLTSFTKMFGLKFLYDSFEKKVQIVTRNNFYKNELINMDYNIDHSKAMKITPTLSQNKWLKYGLETPESYASYLYNLKNTNEYGTLNFNTSYYFNNSTSNIFENNIFQNIIPYRLSSLYFNLTQTDNNGYMIPKPCYSKTYDYTLWDDSGNALTQTRYGLSGNKTLQKMNDSMPKLCCFDKDNGNMSDISNAIVLFDRFEPWGGWIYDNIQAMYDICDSPCHIHTISSQGYDTAESSNILTKTNAKLINFASAVQFLPKFSKYRSDDRNVNYTISLDFKKPSQTFIGDSTAYVDNITIDAYWNRYIYDIYSKNSKKVELYCLLQEAPKDAMRKFYFFDNSLWILNKVVDYKPKLQKPIQCEFVKIEDIEDFTTNARESTIYARIIPRQNLKHHTPEPIEYSSTVNVTDVTLNSSSIELVVGKSQQLTATVYPTNATVKTVVWSSSNEQVASVTDGLVFAKESGTTTITVTTVDGGHTATCNVTVNAESYDYLFEKLSLDGSSDQGDDTDIKLFSDEMTNWTLFGYAYDSKNPNADTNATLYQCVVNASPWSGLRVDADNNAYPKTGSVPSPMIPRLLAGTDNYINPTNGVKTSLKPIVDPTAHKHPVCFSRNGSVFKYSTDGVNWTEITGIQTAQLTRLKDCKLTVGFDYKRSSGSITTTKYRFLKTDHPCCVALKNESEYQFYSLYKKYENLPTE